VRVTIKNPRINGENGQNGAPDNALVTVLQWDFNDNAPKTSAGEAQVNRYRHDLKFFHSPRPVRIRWKSLRLKVFGIIVAVASILSFLHISYV
jgi:hypothetical protein